MGESMRRHTTHTVQHALALVFALALVAAACGEADDAATPADPGAAPADPGTEPDEPARDGAGVEIGVSFYDNRIIPLYVDMEEGMQAAAEEAGATVSFSYANFDPAAQVNQIEQFVTRGVDVILVSPLDRNALVPGYEAARAAGIPIISFANRVDQQHEDLFLGRDWSEMGELMMAAIAEELGGEGTVALITGPPQIDVSRQVSQGWESVLAEHEGLEVVSTLTNPDMSKANGVDLGNTLLASHPDVDAIACTIDQICLGAVQAIEEQGIDHDQIYVASMDADPEAVEQVRTGTGVDFTISQRGFTWGRQAIEIAIAYARGDIPDDHQIPNEFQVVHRGNIAELSPEDLR
jgi:ABC-type sugar transport system substrate-binding protein